MVTAPRFSTISFDGLSLRAATWGSGIPEIVLLHDGLGSIGQWRSVPEAVAERTGKAVLAYERPGHGMSLPTPTGPWPADWLATQAGVLATVLATERIEQPVLVGHSDGGSIALLYGSRPDSRARRIVSLAAHSWVEQVCFDAIVGMRANREAIVRGLARHHDRPDAVFEAWSGGWVSDEFRQWDIRPQLATIAVPTLIAQGAEDAYATEAQVFDTAAAVGPNAVASIVPGVGHIMHHDDADAVVSIICDFALGD